MSDTPIQLSLKDPLSNLARNIRKMLLGSSTLGIFIVKTGLIPSKIPELGIELDPLNQAAFTVILAVVVCYFLFAFVIYGAADFLSWRIAYNESARITAQKSLEFMKRNIEESVEEKIAREWTPKWQIKLVSPTSVVRSLFEFAIPICVGVASIILLLL